MSVCSLLKSEELQLNAEMETNPRLADIWAKVKSNERLADRFSTRLTALHVSLLDYSCIYYFISNCEIYYYIAIYNLFQK